MDASSSSKSSFSSTVSLSLATSSSEEKVEDDGQDLEIRVYRRRWYVLALYCAYCGFQAMIWNSFSPITYAMQLAYDWSDATIALLINWGPIAYCIFAVPFSYMFEKIGARYSVLFGTALVCAGTALRTLATEDPAFLALCHTGLFLNGASGVIVMSFPALISSLWFPESERILATALSQSVNILGVALGQGLGPVAVPYDEKYDDEEAPPSVIQDTVDDVHVYMISTAVVAAVMFLLVLIYFPAAPKHPPSKSTAVERSDFASGWGTLLRSRDAWFACLAMAIPGGFQMGWQGTMAIELEHLGVTDTDVGNIGFVGFFAQAALTLVVGLSMDHFRNKIKLTLVVLLSVSTACFVWLALISLEVIPYSLAQLYVAAVVGTASYFACFPLFFELTLMISHPAPEGIVGAFLTGVYNVFMTIFLLIMMIPDLETSWMNYLVIAGTAAGIPLIYFLPKPKDYM